MSSPSEFTRNTQVIEYLCGLRSFVVDCCCEFPAPTTNQQNTSGSAPPAGSLLTGLQVAYPGTDWSNVATLVDILLQGARRGRYKKLTTNAGDEYWYIDLNMVKKNYSNRQYLPFCSAIKDCRAGDQSMPVY